MRTVHEFVRVAEGTAIRVTITITGPMAWFWWLTAGRTHAAGLPAQTRRFVEHARARSRATALVPG